MIADNDRDYFIQNSMINQRILKTSKNINLFLTNDNYHSYYYHSCIAAFFISKNFFPDIFLIKFIL